MDDEMITTLCVGVPIEMRLGRPVAQGRTIHESAASIRWAGGKWERVSTSLPDEAAGHVEAQNEIEIPRVKKTPKRVWMALAGALALVLMGGVMVWHRASAPIPPPQPQLQQDALPVAPYTAPPPAQVASGVKVVEEPYAAQQANQLPTDSNGRILPPVVQAEPQAAEIPRVNGKLLEQVHEVQTAQPAPVPRVAVTPTKVPSAPKPTAAEKDSDKKVPAALLVDEDAVKKPPAPVSAVPAVPDQARKLVAVSPDGKFAMFSNPKTRIPEKFGIGDKLPSGEIVKSIDKTAGKVTTDAKDYKLE